MIYFPAFIPSTLELGISGESVYLKEGRKRLEKGDVGKPITRDLLKNKNKSDALAMSISHSVVISVRRGGIL